MFLCGLQRPVTSAAVWLKYYRLALALALTTTDEIYPVTFHNYIQSCSAPLFPDYDHMNRRYREEQF